VVPAVRLEPTTKRLTAAGHLPNFVLSIAPRLMIESHAESHAGLRRRWQGRYEHVLVDKFRDVDAAHLDLVATPAEPERNLFVVGDDDHPARSPAPLAGARHNRH
jgi:UvrD/REP helicase N-terminal domain